MEVCWHFYRFDHTRYVALRPALRSATTPAAFAAIAEGPETEAIVEALVENTLPLQAARAAFVQAACCLGEPLPFDRSFPRFVAVLGRRRGAEDAAELLAELLAGRKNLELWLLPASGLVGFLTPEETQTLCHIYRDFTRRGRSGMRRRDGGRRPRRGGLFGAGIRFVQHLLDRAPQDEEVLLLLGELIEEAANRGEGIAVVSV